VKPVEPVEPVKPVEPVEPVKPVEPVEPVKPVEPVEPVKPVEPVEPVKPVEPVEPVKPGEKPRTEPSKPQEPVSAVEGQPNVFKVNDVSALKWTEPSLISLADKAIWHWEFYVELPNGQRAVFCEVNVRPSPHGGTSPDLNLHPKAATVKGGDPVTLKPPGAPWTTRTLQLLIDSYTAKFGHAPKNVGGFLAESNLKYFQETFARLRSQNPGLSNEMLSQMTIREIPFGTQRIPLGYEYFKVTILKVGKVTLESGKTEVLPTTVRVEATKSPFKTRKVPPAHPEVDETEPAGPAAEDAEEFELQEN
jgi:hypothetical protein